MSQKKTPERFAILFYGDAQGGSRDEIRMVTEEEARAFEGVPGWSKAVKITIEDLSSLPERSARDRGE